MGETYEERRRKRVEENKKRMQELNLNTLALALKNSPKPTPVKQSKPRVVREPLDLSAVRRSIRVKDKPAPNYKEIALEPLGLARRTHRRRDLLSRVYAGDAQRECAIEKAVVLQEGLEPEFPSFVKPMLQSHVTGGFWLGLPLSFCKSYLPKCDTEFILEDEDGNESSTKYLGLKNGLSAGWRGFAIEHELVDGDALVFHLVEPTKFKVYIIRVYQSDDDDDAASDVANLGNSAKRVRASKN